MSSMLTLFSAVMGTMAAGLIADRAGRKLSFATSFLFSAIGITLEVVATSSSVFFAGKFINGFAIGGFIATGFTYVGEVSASPLLFGSKLTTHRKRLPQPHYEVFLVLPAPLPLLSALS
jgi:MFS family permease